MDGPNAAQTDKTSESMAFSKKFAVFAVIVIGGIIGKL